MSNARPGARFDARDWRALALVLAGWFALPLLLGTSAHIPLNDDWAYAHTVRTLLETGEFRRPSWTWVPALTHTAWGALFASAFGFGFPALRWSTLVAGALGIAGVFTLGRRIGLATGAAALLAATYGFDPVHVHLGFTFMTDTLFFALCVWSLVFLADFARDGGWGALAAGIAFAVAATLSRQTALVIPAAFALALLISRPLDWRAWLAAVACAAIVAVAYLRAEQWLFETGGRWSRLYSVRDAGKFIAREQSSAAFHFVKNAIATLVVLGWFLAPLVLRVRASLPLRLAASAAGVAAVALLILRLHLDLPPSYNVIWDLGLGPLTIGGKEFLPHAPAGLWWVLTALGAAACAEGIVLVLANVLPRWREWRKRGDVLFLVAFSAGFILPHLPRAPYFDRYAFTLVAPLGAVLLLVVPQAQGGWRPRASAAALALFVALGFAGTRDYLARSEEKWALLQQLRSEGYGERVVVGGVEYNGWYDDFDPLERAPHGRFVWDDEFVASYAPAQPGYSEYARRTYPRWLPPGAESVYVLRRNERQSQPVAGLAR